MANRRMRLIGVLLAVVCLGAAASVYAFSFGKFEKVKADGGNVIIPASKLSEKARFYKFEDSGKVIAFFVVKAKDGSVKTAFDACDACFKAKKGYEQQGDRMNCINCNQKFAINRLGPNATGGCNPGHLPHQLKGGNVVISTGDLRGGAGYF